MKRLIYIFIPAVILVILGIIGYIYIEKWNFVTSLYMTVVTLTTTGFIDAQHLNKEGQVFTVFLLGSGFFILAFTVAMLSKVIIEGELEQLFGRKKVEKKLKNMKSHSIICGYGKMGKIIAKDFSAKNHPFIVIEKDEKICDELNEAGYMYVKGDAKNNDALIKAGIERASSIIPVIDDAGNLFITITARCLNSKINIIAKINEEENRSKFMQVGANKVISPFAISGTKIVRSVLNPTIEDFHEITSGNNNFEFQMAELIIGSNSSLQGKSIAESKISKYGVIIVGLKKKNGTISFPPESTTLIEDGDILISIGKKKGIDKLILESK
ncbi:MAG: potassium channel protein [Proteobacteria bacterium]|nr:potassium channel protein [Pseudomonadota bacterium]